LVLYHGSEENAVVLANNVGQKCLLDLVRMVKVPKIRSYHCFSATICWC